MGLGFGDIVKGLTSFTVGGPIGLSALAGSEADQSSQTTNLNLAPESEFEKQGRLAQQNQFQDLLKLLGGQSVQDIQAQQGRVTETQAGLDKLLAAFAAAGGRPTQEQIGQAQTYAGQIFQPQEVALQQAFQDQTTAANQAAARMGRSFGNDPILRARLAQDQTRQQAQLAAQKSAYAADYANQIPGQAISAQEALFNLRQGIVGQAMQNRLNLLNLGNQIQQQERQFRLASAGQTTTSESGGGLKGAVAGAFGGASAMLNIAGQLKSLGGYGGGGMSSFGGGGGGGGSMPLFQAAPPPPAPSNYGYARSYDVRPGVSLPYEYGGVPRTQSMSNWINGPKANTTSQFMDWLNGPK